MPSLPDEPRSPQALMRRATDVAGICREIVLKTAVTIQGRKFIRVEGWESIATAHGCFAGAENAEREYDTQGNHIGYKAKGVLRNARGEIIATGEGFVGFDEQDRKGNPTWKNRDEYAGKAMAQTRAISRTCRGVFAHVVVLMDAGLSTTPAEEVPDGGFDDEQRVSKARNVTNSPHGTLPLKEKAPAKPPAPAQATEEQKARWLALLNPLGQAAVVYGWEKGWILGPGVDSKGNDTPGEPLEVMGLEHVPTSKRQADTIMAEIQDRMDAPQGDDGDLGPQNDPEHQGTQFDENGDEVETVTGKLEQVSTKEGRSAKGPWKRYGLRVGEEWFNTFDKILGELALKDKGHAVRIQFRRGEKGNDLVSIERPAK